MTAEPRPRRGAQAVTAPCGLILAGGDGRRMGGMKPFVPYRGRPLIAHAVARLGPQVDRLAINVGRPGTALAARLTAFGEEQGLPLVADDPELAGLGPLSGVLAGLAALPAEAVLVTLPCDMPEVPLDLAARLLRRLRETGAPAVHAAGRRPYPLCAAWTTPLLPRLTAALSAARAEGGLRVMRFLADAGAATLPIPPGEEPAFLNLNEPPAPASPLRDPPIRG